MLNTKPSVKLKPPKLNGKWNKPSVSTKKLNIVNNKTNKSLGHSHKPTNRRCRGMSHECFYDGIDLETGEVICSCGKRQPIPEVKF